MATRVLNGGYHEVWSEPVLVGGAVVISTGIPVVNWDPAELSRMEATVYLDAVNGAVTVSKPTFSINPTTGLLDVAFTIAGGTATYKLDVHYHQPQGVDASYAGFGMVVRGGAGGGGGAVTGSPSALVYINLLGTGHLTDPGLTAAPPTPVTGWPQIHDVRAGVAPASYCVWRQGAWVVEGDLINAEGNGVIIYGSAGGPPIDPTHGTKTWLGQRSLSYENMDPAINGGAIYTQMRLDWTGLLFNNNAPVPVNTFNVDATTGSVYCGPVTSTGLIKGANVQAAGTAEGIVALQTGLVPNIATIRAGVGVPLGAVPGVPGDIWLNTLGGPLNTLWVNETGGVGGWVPK